MTVAGSPLPGCPRPGQCLVAVDPIRDLAGGSGALKLVSVPQRPWHRVYSAHDTFATPNPGVGNTRFAPFPDPVSDAMVPTMYLADSLAAALLETVFHNVDVASGAGVVAHRDLHARLHAKVVPPRALRLVDLRDDELSRLDIDRSQLVTSSAEHYPCTRAVAQILHGLSTRVDGLLWHSRQADQQGFGQAETAVVFCDRVPTARTSWELLSAHDALGALVEGSGLAEVNSVAVELGITLSGEF